MVRNVMCRNLFAQRKKYYRHQGPLMIVANSFILKFEPELKFSKLHSLCGLSLVRISNKSKASLAVTTTTCLHSFVLGVTVRVKPYSVVLNSKEYATERPVALLNQNQIEREKMNSVDISELQHLL